MPTNTPQWEIDSTEEFDDWFEGLESGDQEHIDAALRVLERQGPGLGRPLADSIASSKHSNMKELRPGRLRLLFVFDPNRHAVLLLGGDKTNRWQAWYKENILRADELYDKHLEELRQQAQLPPKGPGKKGKLR
jgi:hypothetical protein